MGGTKITLAKSENVVQFASCSIGEDFCSQLNLYKYITFGKCVTPLDLHFQLTNWRYKTASLCGSAGWNQWARCVTVPPTWGHRTPLAAQSKVGSESALGCASTFQREWRGAVGTAGLGYWTHDPDGSLPLAQLERPIPWASPRRATSIHTL